MVEELAVVRSPSPFIVRVSKGFTGAAAVVQVGGGGGVRARGSVSMKQKVGPSAEQASGTVEEAA